MVPLGLVVIIGIGLATIAAYMPKEKAGWRD